MKQCYDKVGLKSGWCSSGMSGVLWAMEKCSSVTVFGAKHDPCYPYHYLDPMPTKCTVKSVNDYINTDHDFEKEHLVLQRMVEDGLMYKR